MCQAHNFLAPWLKKFNEITIQQRGDGLWISTVLCCHRSLNIAKLLENRCEMLCGKRVRITQAKCSLSHV